MWRPLLLTISICGLIGGCTMPAQKDKDRTLAERKSATEKDAKIKEKEKKKPQAVLLDNFERDMKWATVSWPNVNKCEVERIAGKKDNHLLSLMSHEGNGEKVAIERGFKEPRDFSQYKRIVFDAKVHGDDSLSLAMGIMTDAYYETDTKKVHPGRNKDTTFLLTKENFKSEKTDWKHISDLKQAQKVKSLYFLLYTQETRHIEIDNIRAFKEHSPN